MTPIANLIFHIGNSDTQAATTTLAEIVRQKLEARYSEIMKSVKKDNK